MRFSLQDVKKQVHRRSGELYVSLHFLRPEELQNEIESLIAYYEQLLGRPQRDFSMDDARACIGDYRMAHCLISALSAWYSWRQCDWLEVLQRMGDEPGVVLDEAGITSPVHLRLALFNYVNEHYSGFLDAEKRTEALQVFAAPYKLNISDLEYLLALDTDDEAVLVRDAAQPPTVQDVATLYNQWAFEAALFNASQVRFVLDCNAFEVNDGGQWIASRMTGTGVGAVIKRLCYLARRLGVYYDIGYEGLTSVGQGGDKPRGYNPRPYHGTDSHTDSVLHLTLYGPQEMTGAPQQYGLRLARLCRLLLGYGVSGQSNAKDMPGHPKQRGGATGTTILSSAIVEAEATVHFLQRSYCFAMDNKVLSLLPPTTGQLEAARGDVQPSNAPSVFDSSIEQSFAEAFTALENSQAVEGWRLLREPEPLLLEAGGIFIPDFALTRAGRRIYVEILGFWTPSYRERKTQKLQQLQEREDIVLAIPVEAKEAFSSIAAKFPIVWYEGQLSAIELLNLLRSRYDDFAERLASINVDEVRRRVERDGLIPERVCYELLQCYRRSELAMAAERVVGQGIAFGMGIGLYQVDWMEQLRKLFVEWIGSVGVLPLADVLRESRMRWPKLANCEDATIEAIVGLWPKVYVRRTSIFEAVVEVANLGTYDDANVEAQFIAANNQDDVTNSAPIKKPSRERRSIQKKRVVKEVAQGDLWS